MGLLVNRTESSHVLASRAFTKAENALSEMIDAKIKTTDAIAGIETSIDDLSRQKTELLDRQQNLDFAIRTMTKALFGYEEATDA